MNRVGTDDQRADTCTKRLGSAKFAMNRMMLKKWIEILQFFSKKDKTNEI